jgi:outer membrane protein OmpA-like peptidoglycan-associated protein
MSKARGATVTFAGTEFTHGAMVTGDDITAVSLSSAGATSGAAVGGYPIVAALPVVGAGSANYDITFVNGTLTVVAVPTTRLLLTVRFTHTSTVLTAAWKAHLHTWASNIKANGYRSITITGYTEKVPGGNLASRKRLSLLRARAVRTYLLGELAKLHYSVSIAAVGTAGPGGKTYNYPRAEVVATNLR